jgi:hypothetical protein
MCKRDGAQKAPETTGRAEKRARGRALSPGPGLLAEIYGLTSVTAPNCSTSGCTVLASPPMTTVCVREVM